jgi:hypothetical protein
MPKLREPPSQVYPPASEKEPCAPNPGQFVKGRRKSGGRTPGVGNFFSLGVRESILTALSNCGGERGLVGFIENAVREDTGYGIKLLVALAPRQADLTVRSAPSITTLQELDEQLARLNLPSTYQLFGPAYALDFKGDPVEADEAEVVAEEAAKK